MRIIFFICTILVATVAQATFQTPQGNSFLQWQTYEFQFGNSGDEYYQTGIDQDYIVYEYRQVYAPEDQSSAITTLEDYACELDSGHAAHYIDAHGSSDAHAVEAYANTSAGCNARDNAYDQYISDGWYPDEIFKTQSSGGYDIYIYATTISEFFYSQNTIVYNLTCHGHDYQSIAWPGSRCRLGYTYSVGGYEGNSESRSFWNKMNGESGKNNRNATNARSGLGLSLSGNGNTVLSPAISSYSPTQYTYLNGPTQGSVTFDTEMSNSNADYAIYGFNDNGACLVEDAFWDNITTLSFTIQPYVTGNCGIYITSSAESNGNRQLDGNTNPSGSDARGPNRDSYRINYYSTYDDPNLAASFEGAWAYLDYDGVHILWITDPEINSLSFDVYGGANREHLLANIPASGGNLPHYYETIVHEEYDLYEVVENDKDYSTEYSTRPFSLSSNPPSNINSLRSLNQRQFTRSNEFNEYSDYTVTRDVEITDFVYYSSRSDFLSSIQPVIDYWQGQGRSSQTILGSNDPNECRSIMRSIWQQAIDQGYPRLPFLIIVGEANQGSEPDKNIVGTFYPDDELSNCYWGCSSDVMIVDFDDDNLPDIPWTRIIGCELSEIQNSVQSALDFYNQENISSEKVFILDGDLSGSCEPLTEPRQTLEEIQGLYEDNSIPSIISHDSEYSSCYAYSERLEHGRNIVNSGITEMIGIGNITNRSVLPGYIFQKVYDPIFSMEEVIVPQRIVAQFPGCGLGDCDRDNPSYYPSIAKMFLTADPETHTTAVTWLAHMRGGYQELHLQFAKTYFNQRFCNESWSTHDAYFNAIRILGEQEQGVRDYLLSAGAFGWPVNMSGMGGSVSVPDDLPSTVNLTILKPNVPNPFNPQTNINYSIPGLAKVSLTVYNVKGRKVKTLLSPTIQEAGEYSLSWKAKDENDNSVASGVYFYRLDVGNSTYTRKMLLLK